MVSPASNTDIHRVRNVHNDRVPISIHRYGGNIHAISRNSFNLASGKAQEFTSDYANDLVPNIWHATSVLPAE